MFSKKFDRRIYLFIIVLSLSVGVGGTFGLYALWPPNLNTGYEPEQPIPFSHRLHAGDLQIDCRYCHTQVDKGAHATVPSVSVCMNCHARVQTRYAADHPDPQKQTELKDGLRILLEGMRRDVYGTLHGLTDKDAHGEPIKGEQVGPYADPKTGKAIKEIRWLKVHDVSDFAFFDHSRHIKAGLDCSACHGNVKRMDRIVKVNPLTMNWCLKCHRNPRKVAQGKTTNVFLNLPTGVPELPKTAPTNCWTCHR